MNISKDHPDYTFEKYEGYIIASHKNNSVERHVNNLNIVYRAKDFPEYGYLVGLDDTKLSGPKKMEPNNLEDAKDYIDSLIASQQEKQNLQNALKELPIVHIAERPFYVNVKNYEFIDCEYLPNTLNIFDMQYTGNSYKFLYSEAHHGIADQYEADQNNRIVEVPTFVQLDPGALAQKYNCQLQDLIGKTDYDIMIDKQALFDRLSGRLTTIDICDHTFYVDFHMQKLRPHDDFLSPGISFEDLEENFNLTTHHYEIPYDAKKHTVGEIDYENIVKIPQNLTCVAIPELQKLDPVGYARSEGWDLHTILRETPQLKHFQARSVDWKDTYLPVIIKENKGKERKKGLHIKNKNTKRPKL
ncbi:TPA: hypothetical protein NEG48_001086 [Elizabethkingia anophelis]|nr:hypothetical protein [Elizabethkingia anophelis]